MSDPSIHLMGLHIMLAEADANGWKDVLINKALMLNAYDVFMGTETLASVGMDETVVTNFKAHQLQLAGNIGSMLNEAHHALLRNATPKIALTSVHGIWNFIVNHLKSRYE